MQRRPQRTRKPSAKLTGADLSSATKHIKKNYLKLREEGYVSPTEEKAIVDFEETVRAQGAMAPQESGWKVDDEYKPVNHFKKAATQNYMDHQDTLVEDEDVEYTEEVSVDAETNFDGSIHEIMMQDEAPTLPVAKGQYADMSVGRQVRRVSSSALKKVGKTKAGYTKGAYAATYGDRGPNNKLRMGEGKSYDHYADWGWTAEDIALLNQGGYSPRREVSRRHIMNLPDAYEYDTEEDECDSEEVLMANEEEFDEDTTEKDIIDYAVEQSVLHKEQQRRRDGGSGSSSGSEEVAKGEGKEAAANPLDNAEEDLGGLLNSFSVTVATRRSINLANKQLVYRRDQCTQNKNDSDDNFDDDEGGDAHGGAVMATVKEEDDACGMSGDQSSKKDPTKEPLVISSETFAARPAVRTSSPSVEGAPEARSDDVEDDKAYDPTPYESAYIRAVANGICIPKRTNSRRTIRLRRMALLTHLQGNLSGHGGDASYLHRNSVSRLSAIPSTGMNLPTKAVNPFCEESNLPWRSAHAKASVEMSDSQPKSPNTSAGKAESEVYLVPPKNSITVYWDDILACFYSQADEVFRATDPRDTAEGLSDGASVLPAYFESVLVSPESFLTINRIRMPDGTLLSSKHNERYLRLYLMAEAARSRRVDRVTPRWYPLLALDAIVMCLDAQSNGQHQLQHNHQDMALQRPGGKKGIRHFNQHLAMQAAIWNTYVAAVKVEADNRVLWDKYQVTSTYISEGVEVKHSALSPHNYYALPIEIEVPEAWSDIRTFRKHMIDNHLYAASPLSGTGPGSIEAHALLDDLWQHIYGSNGVYLGEVDQDSVYGGVLYGSVPRQTSTKKARKNNGSSSGAYPATVQGLSVPAAEWAMSNTSQEAKGDLAWLQKLDAFCGIGGTLSALVSQAVHASIKQMRKAHRMKHIPWPYAPLALQELSGSLVGKINAERFFNLDGKPESTYGAKFPGTYTDEEESKRLREMERKKKQDALTKQAQSMLAVTEKMRQQAMRAQIQQNMRAQQAKAAAAFALQRSKVIPATSSTSAAIGAASSSFGFDEDVMDTAA